MDGTPKIGICFENAFEMASKFIDFSHTQVTFTMRTIKKMLVHIQMRISK